MTIMLFDIGFNMLVGLIHNMIFTCQTPVLRDLDEDQVCIIYIGVVRCRCS
jgi:hypothetical protein